MVGAILLAVLETLFELVEPLLCALELARLPVDLSGPLAQLVVVPVELGHALVEPGGLSLEVGPLGVERLLVLA